jgi:ornithine cyclodeaminase
MPAWSEAGYLGIKTINIFPGNSAHGLPGLHATYVLYDAHTGVPLALMDGNEITAHRTAAASALGASFLARSDARRLLVLGTGRVARLLPAAHAGVRAIAEVQVWNHRPEGAEALAAQWRSEGWNAQAAGDLEAAVRNADIVSCATLATSPLVRGEWLAPGSHLDLIGSFTPQMREADPACFAGARTFVDTDEALSKAGDLLDAIAAGTLSRDGVQATLAELCRGTRGGRADDSERTVFKAVGSALEDLAAATLVWQQEA